VARVDKDDPFPYEAVRDLLGVVRALYAAAKAAEAGAAELARISRVGSDLRRALELARSSRPGTLGHRAATQRAADATLRVGDLVDGLTPAEPLVAAARGRVSGTRRAPRKKVPDR
jgi:hypothetical protein